MTTEAPLELLGDSTARYETITEKNTGVEAGEPIYSVGGSSGCIALVLLGVRHGPRSPFFGPTRTPSDPIPNYPRQRLSRHTRDSLSANRQANRYGSRTAGRTIPCSYSGISVLCQGLSPHLSFEERRHCKSVVFPNQLCLSHQLSGPFRGRAERHR